MTTAIQNLTKFDLEEHLSYSSKKNLFKKKQYSLKHLQNTFASLAFFLLFPGFFFYHTLLGIGQISAVLGGFFAIISIILIFPLTFLYLSATKGNKRKFSKIELYFSHYLLYFFITILINYSWGANKVIVMEHLLAVNYTILLFIIFRLINLDDKFFKKFSILSLISMSAIIFYYSVDGAFYLENLGISKSPQSLATYQGFARSYLITLIICLALTKKITSRMILYALAIPSLFINSARSEFVAVLFLIPIIEICHAKYKLNTLLGIVLLILFIALNIHSLLDLVPKDNRVLELLDLSRSTSANLRHILSDNAIKTIYENPIFGSYASYPPGNYAHNILSAWVDLGLFGFIYVIALLVIPALKIFIYGLFFNKKNSEYILAVSLVSITILLLLTAHDYTDMLIGAALGAYENFKSKEKKRIIPSYLHEKEVINKE